MSLTVSCEQCHRRLLARPEYLGRSIKCPACGHVQTAAEEATTTEVPTPGYLPRAFEPSPLPPEPSDEPRSRGRGVPLAFPDDDSDARPRRRRRRGDNEEGPRSACPYCDEPIRPDSTECRWCGEEIDPAWLHGEAERMRAERHRALWVAGSSAVVAILMGLAIFVGSIVTHDAALLVFLAVPGIAWTIAGIYLARFKGQHPALGLLALFVWPYFVGPIVLLCLSDKKGKGIRRLERFLARQ